MSDGTNDALMGGDDDALFQDVISGGPAPADPQPGPDPTPAQQPAVVEQPQAVQPAPQAQQPEPAIPPSRLREEAEARRAAERRAMELEARLAALERTAQPQQPPQQRQRSDVFENPSAFVQEEVQPILDPVTQEITRMREFYSRREAEREHGGEKVKAAYDWISQGIAQRDPEAVMVYQRAMQSMDPYGDITRAHLQRQTFQEIGPDLNAYRQRILDEALKDQAFQARVLEAARAQAQATGATIAKPVVTSLPNINRVGAAALPEGQVEESDADLFSKVTTSRKRA
ncbi:hypothetical protein [Bradyrhizobium oligotrophicum]|uniref:hypothetical protein n=1 Tax=Bradyrhizobium oligotrophicum TaxID=44255 RepID=UPI003EBA751C